MVEVVVYKSLFTSRQTSKRDQHKEYGSIINSRFNHISNNGQTTDTDELSAVWEIVASTAQIFPSHWIRCWLGSRFDAMLRHCSNNNEWYKKQTKNGWILNCTILIFNHVTNLCQTNSTLVDQPIGWRFRFSFALHFQSNRLTFTHAHGQHVKWFSSPHFLLLLFLNEHLLHMNSIAPKRVKYFVCFFL